MNDAKMTREFPIAEFRARFGADPEFLVRTPGRVNLIGEHTDYNGGFVFPMTIDRAVWIAVRRRDDGIVRVRSSDYRQECDFSLRKPLLRGPVKKNQEQWFEYVKGCAWVLREEGLPLCGFDALLTGDVPQGAGLSSSAALELTVVSAFGELGGWGNERPKIEWAKLAQRAENQWVGVKCGIMDQAICALGQADKAMLLDCRSLEHKFFALHEGSLHEGNLHEATVVAVLDTATRHSLAASAYNERREQCEAACKALGLSLLRDATLEMLDAHKSKMPEVVYRRALHVVSENLRTLAAARALQNSDRKAFGNLMDESHRSLRDDFEVSCFELDAMVAAARGHPACLGARMTGGGFGGSAVALLDSASAEGFADTVSDAYRQKTGKEPHVTVCRATKGASVERV